MNEFPQSVEKKVKLLNYFRNYMKEHLLKAGANIEVRIFLNYGTVCACSEVPVLWIQVYCILIHRYGLKFISGFEPFHTVQLNFLFSLFNFDEHNFTSRVIHYIRYKVNPALYLFSLYFYLCASRSIKDFVYGPSLVRSHSTGMYSVPGGELCSVVPDSEKPIVNVNL